MIGQKLPQYYVINTLVKHKKWSIEACATSSHMNFAHGMAWCLKITEVQASNIINGNPLTAPTLRLEKASQRLTGRTGRRSRPVQPVVVIGC